MTRNQAKISLAHALSIYVASETEPIDPLVLAEVALTHCESVINMSPPAKINLVKMRDMPEDRFMIWSYEEVTQQWDID